RGACGAPEGVFVGTLFRRTSAAPVSPRISCLEADDGARLSGSAGRSAFSDYWGNYIGLIRAAGGTAVIASPTSAIPCYFVHQAGVVFVFSHLEKCACLDLGKLTLNTGFISALLAYDKIQNGETGFNEIRELLGGERLLVTGDRLGVDTIWDPRDIARGMRAPPLQDAAAELRDTGRHVVRSWASCFGRVAVNLSGGLDSSIVLSCLAGAPGAAQVSAVHHRLVSEDPTELHYARAAAAFLGCPLTEVPVRSDAAFPAIDSHPLSVRPYRQFLDPDLVSLFGPHLPGLADAFFTGQGGDHLFLVRRTPLGFADYLHDRGPGPGAGRHLLEAARLSGLSVWKVLQETLRARGQSQSAMVRAIAKRRARMNAGGEQVREASELVPGWARDASGLPPAKFDQVGHLVHLFQERETLDRPISRRFVHPLVSQPLIELCLRFPVYLLCAGGQSRGLARRAFEGGIPDRIRLRMTKGESTRFFIDQLTLNRDQIAGALTGGELAALGFIDAGDIQSFLSRDTHETGRYGHTLLIFYVIEAWLRRWRSQLGGLAPPAP
ncbi:MAG: asparagine synthase C-terminal domain-containing protein, partial [Hyphomonas sp.]|nr:asparagine synthase C-terminal domain-containing protein [Hyphomonas sp.]